MTNYRYEPESRRFINEDEERERQKISDAQLRERAKQWPQRELTIRREERERCAREQVGWRYRDNCEPPEPWLVDFAWWSDTKIAEVRARYDVVEPLYVALPDKDKPNE